MTTIINLYCGPGGGKSTTAADLFAEMKWRGRSVELINEAAKDMTWEGHFEMMKDQLWVSAHQHRKIARLVGQVDYIITDSPLMLCAVYAEKSYPKTFFPYIKELNDTYNNFNVYIKRHKPYVPVGRNQTEEEARSIDQRLWIDVVEKHRIPIHLITEGNREAKHEILRALNDHSV